MSLYEDLTEILTPYADKINQNTASLNDLRDDLDNLDVETDTTLSVDGKPADAKKTGDEISQIKADLGDISDEQNINLFDEFVANGYYTISSSAVVTRAGNGYARSSDKIPIDPTKKYVVSLQNYGAYDFAKVGVRTTNGETSASAGTITDTQLNENKALVLSFGENARLAGVTFSFYVDNTRITNAITLEEFMAMCPKLEEGEVPTPYTPPQTGARIAKDTIARESIASVESDVEDIKDASFDVYGFNMLGTCQNGRWTIADGGRQTRSGNDRIRNTDVITVKPATEYTFSVADYGRFLNLAFGCIQCDENGNLVGNGQSDTGFLKMDGNLTYTFVTPVNCHSIGISYAFSETETFVQYTGAVTVGEFEAMCPKLEEGNTATAYTEPQKGITTAKDAQARLDIDALKESAEKFAVLNRRTRRKGWLVSAHRGNCFYNHTKLATSSNTLAAVYQAFVNGADYVEIDARRTADDVFISSHDATITGYDTSGNSVTYTIAETNAADICALYLSNDSKYGKQYIPTTEQMLKLIYQMGGRANIDIKSGLDADALAVASLVRTCGMAGRVMYALNGASASAFTQIIGMDSEALFMGSLGYFQTINVKSLITDYSKRCYAFVNLVGGGADRIASMQAIKAYGINLCIASVGADAHEAMRSMYPEMVEYSYDYDWQAYEDEYVDSITPVVN